MKPTTTRWFRFYTAYSSCIWGWAFSFIVEDGTDVWWKGEVTEVHSAAVGDGPTLGSGVIEFSDKVTYVKSARPVRFFNCNRLVVVGEIHDSPAPWRMFRGHLHSIPPQFRKRSLDDVECTTKRT